MATEATEYCERKTKRGTRCQQRAGHGTGHPGVGACSKHGGSTPNGEVAGQVFLARRDAMAMGVPLDIPPTRGILECIRIAAGEVRYASERIALLQESDLVGPVTSTVDRPLKDPADPHSEGEMIMGMLYEPDKPTDRFSLTPDYDRLMAEFAEAHPDPRFSTEECRPFGFRWPARFAR